jgi:hypothetical protein
MTAVATAAPAAEVLVLAGCISFSPQPQHKYTEIPTDPPPAAPDKPTTMCSDLRWEFSSDAPAKFSDGIIVHFES